MNDSQSVQVSRTDDDVLIITLSRPEVRNAMDAESWHGLIDAFASIEDSGARAVVLTGAGRAFCSGGDLNSMLMDPKPGLYGETGRLQLAQQAVRSIWLSKVPVIAAVPGAAAGVGWSLALVCDVIIAAEDAFFVAPFLDRGVIPDGGLIWFLTQSVGHHRALGMILSKRRVSAAEAFDSGFVHEVTASGAALARATEIASDLAHGPTETIGLARRLVARASEVPLPQYLDLEQDAIAFNQFSGNPAEGVAAWRESRAPRF